MRWKISAKVAVQILGLVLVILSLSYSSRFFLINKSNGWMDRPKMVIVTLIRSENRSISLVINMIHSILYFYPRNKSFQHPFLIFHDENLTLSMQNRIRSCIAIAQQAVEISFVQVRFQSTVQPNPKSRQDKSIGYRIMCQFWSYDVFHHPAIVKGGYDYLMRMDDDSYFADKIPEDFLDYMIKNKIDYLYRSHYAESMDSMMPIYRRYKKNGEEPRLCIYNNFFVMRLKWFHQSAKLQSFLRDLIRDNLMLKEYIGDGCVHQAMLQLVEDTNDRILTSVFYGHNYHLHPINQQGWGFYHLPDFANALQNTCDTITVPKLNPLELKRIKIS